MERHSKRIIIIVIILVGLILIPKLKILFEGEKGRIKRIVYAAKKATERENLFRCISFLSKDYTDKYGNNLQSMLVIGENIFKLYDDIVIRIKKLAISLDTNKAEAEIEARGMARDVKGKETNLLETETMKFIIFFQKEDVGWKVVSLEFLEPQIILPPGFS